MKNKVLLARPSSFIVNDMKRLMTEMGYRPTPISRLSDVGKMPLKEILGAVVSNQLSSSIPEDYKEVILEIKRVNPSMPVLLASLVEFTGIEKGLRAKFEGTPFVFFAVHDVARKLVFNTSTDILVIHLSDITDEIRLKNTASVLNRFFV